MQVQVSNSIHPSAIVAGDVKIGSGNTIGPFVVITGPVTIGDDNWIGTGVTIGAPPEVRSFEHPLVFGGGVGEGVRIGNRNVIREYAQIHQGWHSSTVIGDDCFLMNQVYVAHDCAIASDVTLASSVLLAGHVGIGQGANLGLGTSVHQRVKVGGRSMVGMGSVVTRDVLPFAKVFGNPARLRGANSVGMTRIGISDQVVSAVAQQYSESAGAPDLELLSALPGLESFFEFIARPASDAT